MDRDPHTAQISRRRRIIINAQSESVLLKIFRVLILIQIDGTWLARVLKKPLITAGQRRYHWSPISLWLFTCHASN